MFYVCRYCCHCTKCGACPCTTPSWPTAWSSSWKRTPPSPSLSLCPCLGRDNNITSSKIMWFFLPQVEVPPSTLRFLQYCSMILQRPRIIVGDAGFEPGTSVLEVWRATNEPPHLLEQPYHTVHTVDSALVTKTSTANAAKELKRNLPTLNNITHHSMQKQQRFHIYGEKSIKIQC